MDGSIGTIGKKLLYSLVSSFRADPIYARSAKDYWFNGFVNPNDLFVLVIRSVVKFVELMI